MSNHREPVTSWEGLVPLISVIARELTHTRPSLYDDARQEGIIAAWRVQQARPDTGAGYWLTSARNRVREIVRGQPPFGAEVGTKRYDAHSHSTPHGTLSSGTEPLPGAVHAALEGLAAPPPTVGHVAITEALQHLPAADRGIVQALMDGWTATDYSRHVGMSPRWATRRVREHIRPALQHLTKETQ